MNQEETFNSLYTFTPNIIINKLSKKYSFKLNINSLFFYTIF